jgi:hypothetical protein
MKITHGIGAAVAAAAIGFPYDSMAQRKPKEPIPDEKMCFVPAITLTYKVEPVGFSIGNLEEARKKGLDPALDSILLREGQYARIKVVVTSKNEVSYSTSFLMERPYTFCSGCGPRTGEELFITYTSGGFPINIKSSKERGTLLDFTQYFDCAPKGSYLTAIPVLGTKIGDVSNKDTAIDVLKKAREFRALRQIQKKER